MSDIKKFGITGFDKWFHDKLEFDREYSMRDLYELAPSLTEFVDRKIKMLLFCDHLQLNERGLYEKK